MREIAIVGAGALGGAIAHTLAQRDLARRITLVDEHGRVAEGKALDIAQASPVEGFAATLAGTTDIAHVAGAEVVVIADRFAGGDWQDEEALALLRRVSQMAPRAVILLAGEHAVGAIDRGARELKLPRLRLIGSAPDALAGGARALVALAVNCSPRDVALAVLGVPPAATVIPWSDATIGGLPLTRLMDEPSRRRLERQIGALWPQGPLALAAAATKVIAAIDGRTRELACCFVAPDVANGARTRTAALPVRLGPAGIAEIVVPPLSVVERVALDNATLL